MHLEFADTPLSEKDREKNIELCAKLNEYERINAFLNSSNHTARQTVQENEGKIKTLKDALQAKEDIVKQLTDRIETLEAFSEYLSSNTNNAPDVTNGSQNKMESNKKQQPNKNNKFNNNKKQANKGKGGNNYKNENVPNKEELPSNFNKEIQTDNEKNSSDDDVENIASASKEQSTSNEKQEASTTTKVGNTVMIKNFRSSDLDKDISSVNVIALAEKMGLSLTIHQIKDIHAFRENENFVTYIVEFHTKHMQEAFLGKKHILKKHPETKFLFIL